jgi:REP element-mobilizing transposase RayT
MRHEYPGAVYHAMCRGNNGQEIFLEDGGRRLFLSTLEEACGQTGWVVHAYVLMSNHYHLLFETPEPNLVAGMKWLQGAYTQRFNSMFRRRGHLFQGRYKALPVETGAEGYFREVGQYIHLNPYRAKLAGIGLGMRLEEYEWSSYPFYAGLSGKMPGWLCRTRLLAACGLVEGNSGCRKNFKALTESRMLGEADGLAEEEREVVEQQIRRGWYIGNASFGMDLAGRIAAATDNLRGGQRRTHDEVEAERLLAMALGSLGLGEDELLKLKSVALEKQAVAWLLKRNTTVTGVWIAHRLNMGHRVNASRAISLFDKRTDTPAKKAKSKMLQCTG